MEEILSGNSFGTVKERADFHAVSAGSKIDFSRQTAVQEKQIEVDMGKKQLWNDGWMFQKQSLVGVAPEHVPEQIAGSQNRLREEAWTSVSVPHDWLINQADRLYEDSIGWYRKSFSLKKAEGKRYEVYFEGVYMDTTVYVNGTLLGEWKYGYSSFFFDMTELLREDGQENEILVRVVHLAPNSRWYSGAGIYRNVWLIEQPEIHFVTDGLYVTSIREDGENGKETGEWRVEVSAEVAGGNVEKNRIFVSGADSEKKSGIPFLRMKLTDAADGKELPVKLCVPLTEGMTQEAMQNVLAEEGKTLETMQNVPEEGTTQEVMQNVPAGGMMQETMQNVPAAAAMTLELRKKLPAAVTDHSAWAVCAVTVTAPRLWSLEDPALYDCVLELIQRDEEGRETILDRAELRIGFRTISFDTSHGFFLNGIHVKINGVCEHHDLGCIGAAFSKTAMRRKIRILKEMGVNSIRCAHNMPAPELLDLADEEGVLIMNEAFDMWERQKTTYDYARFFPDWYQKDIASFVRRDRNHPSIILWSVGNEVSDTHANEQRGQELTRLLMGETRKHDPLFHAPITIGSNYMPWENTRKCADILKYIGYNYAEKYYDAHHAEHPDWYIFGSETASTVQSRGIYHFPFRQSVLADVDEQCSALGNSTTSWGAKSSEACVLAERDHPFSMGQYLWTGFDYIGEPTPYHTRNSYFGQIDTAGFPKDSYYIYQAEWTDYKKKPMVHVFPYWDFNEGQEVDVRVCSNAPLIELFVNGRSMGEYAIDHAKGTQLVGHWLIPYETGEITAVAYNENHQEIARESRHSYGEPARITVRCDRPTLYAGCNDLAFVEIGAEDENGYPVENAVNFMEVNVEGAGWLTGLDNGDSTDEEEYKGCGKRLFSGKLLAVVAAGPAAGTISVTVSSRGLDPVMLTLNAESGHELAGSSQIPVKFGQRTAERLADRPVWARKIELSCPAGNRFDDSCREKIVTASILPADAMEQELFFEVVNDAGIKSHLASVESFGKTAKITALGDGSFRLRCYVKNGTGRAKVISQLEFTAEGLGAAYFNPYQLIAGGMYTWHEGEAGNGNEHGVSTARDGRTVVSYEGIDFGSFGSDRITLPVFELGSAVCPIEIWEGIPGREGSELLLRAIYHKKSIWNTYQEESYQLPRRVKGITAISFVLNQKIHLKGFVFDEPDKAHSKIQAKEADSIYGDQYVIDADCVRDIGNNVTLEFHDMDFGAEGISRIVLCGKTANDVNSIRISFIDEEGEKLQMVEFPHSEETIEAAFDLEPVTGMKKVQFVFLPGCQFDFSWFQFE